MPLTEEQERRFVYWCTARGICATCPMCGKNDWAVGEVIAPQTFGTGGTIDPPGAAAMIQIVCDHCKLVLLFSASPILGDEE